MCIRTRLNMELPSVPPGYYKRLTIYAFIITLTNFVGGFERG